MTHATPVELHDHAYGFQLSEHIASCADCRRAVDAITVERQGLKDVLREVRVEVPADLLVRLEAPRAPRRKFSAPALIAAAVLLGALTWLLFQPKMHVEPPPSPASASTHEEDLEKIIGQLKSSSPLKQELARMALKKYGGIAVPLLERAKADPVLIEECRGFNLKDQEAYRKAQSTRLTVAWKDTPLPDAIDQLRSSSGINFHVTSVDNPYEIRITLKLQNASIVEILDQLKTLTKLSWGRSQGLNPPKSMLVDPPAYEPILVFGTEAPAPRSSAPVRIRSIRGWAAEQLRLKPDTRTAVEYKGLFQRLTLAADPSVWDYLDFAREDVRKLAEDSLRTLYGPPAPDPRYPLNLKLEETVLNITGDTEKSYADEILALGRAEVPIFWDPRLEIPQESITFKVKDLALKHCLKLLIGQKSLDYYVFPEWILITKPEWLPFRISVDTPLWTTVEEVGRAETVIEDLASEVPARQERAAVDAKEAGRRGLSWLVHGNNGVDSKLHRRFLDASASLAADLGIPIANRGREGARQKLTPAQTAILDRTLQVETKSLPLDALLKGQGVKVRMAGPVNPPLLVGAPALTVSNLLRAVTQPLRLDFYLDGDTIVVDTEQNVRAAVEKK
jgi:hypothetical protein